MAEELPEVKFFYEVPISDDNYQTKIAQLFDEDDQLWINLSQLLLALGYSQPLLEKRLDSFIEYLQTWCGNKNIDIRDIVENEEKIQKYDFRLILYNTTHTHIYIHTSLCIILVLLFGYYRELGLFVSAEGFFHFIAFLKTSVDIRQELQACEYVLAATNTDILIDLAGDLFSQTEEGNSEVSITFANLPDSFRTVLMKDRVLKPVAKREELWKTIRVEMVVSFN